MPDNLLTADEETYGNKNMTLQKNARYTMDKKFEQISARKIETRRTYLEREN